MYENQLFIYFLQINIKIITAVVSKINFFFVFLKMTKILVFKLIIFILIGSEFQQGYTLKFKVNHCFPKNKPLR